MAHTTDYRKAKVFVNLKEAMAVEKKAQKIAEENSNGETWWDVRCEPVRVAGRWDWSEMVLSAMKFRGHPAENPVMICKVYYTD